MHGVQPEAQLEIFGSPEKAGELCKLKEAEKSAILLK